MTLQEIKKYYKEVFYIKEEDDSIIDLLCAIALSSWTTSDAIWLLVIGPPSCGKSELVNSLSGVPFAHQVSTLTENAFLSAMPGSDGKEKSLLHRIGKNGLLLMKDYTSILNTKDELRKKILADMREIYEGKIVKATGTGKDLDWVGKINFIGAVTDAIYMNEGDDASMGRRTIDYVMPPLDHLTRIKMAKRNSKNISDAQEKREKIKAMFAEYIQEKRKELPTTLPSLPEELEDEIIAIADFSTIMRTTTKRNFHGDLTFAPENEAPMRMCSQLQILAQMMIWLNGGKMKEEYKSIIVKVALDSISRPRRMCLRILAQYDKVATKGVAQALNYPSPTTLNWLEDINVLGGCSRSIEGNRDVWIIKKHYREVMMKYDGIKHSVGEELIGTEYETDYREGRDYNVDEIVKVEAEKNQEINLNDF